MPELNTEDERWTNAIAQVNSWRGDCVQSFAHSESAVTETLLILNHVPEKGTSVKLPHLIGQRFEALKLATGSAGPFAEDGVKAHEAISGFLIREQLRAFLCHGVAKVALERSGNWIVIFNLTTLRSQKCERTQLVVTQSEAKALLEEIRFSGNKLGAVLGNLRKKFAD